MGTQKKLGSEPNWDVLYEIASAQEGFFTKVQAAQAGYSSQLLYKYLQNGRISRVRRGIYRLVHFPPGDLEDLVVIWLWTEQTGVFSHETALMLHELSDVMPATVHVTLPVAWNKRRLRTPPGIRLHFNNIEDTYRTWKGVVPITNAEQTLRDCADVRVAPDFVRDALDQALERGLVNRDKISQVLSYLQQYYSVQGELTDDI